MTAKEREEKRLIKNCILGTWAESKYCSEEKCMKCGWNPIIAEARKKDKFHQHQSGLWGF